MNNKTKINALKEQKIALTAKVKKMKEMYITTLLKQLDQPYMVFDNKIFIIPTTSPMWELLPQTSFSNGDFNVGVKLVMVKTLNLKMLKTTLCY